MIRHNISRVIVVSNNSLLGMVTEKGIVSYLFKNSKGPLDEISISRAMRMPIRGYFICSHPSAFMHERLELGLQVRRL